MSRVPVIDKEVSESIQSPSNCHQMSELVFKVPVTATRGQYYYPESQSLPLEVVKECPESKPLTKEVSKVSRVPVIVTSVRTSIQSPCQCHQRSVLLSMPLEVDILSRVPIIL